MIFTSEVDFLKSLDMVSEVEGFNSFNIPRIAQLSQRSNQFNLRTIRYTEADIKRFSSDSCYHNFCFTLKDKFGDNGLISVVILEKQNTETLFVNMWIMSCRVLKRGMENFTLNIIVEYARNNGFKKIIGEYIATDKNKMVEDHYTKLGFIRMTETDRKLYILKTDSYKEKKCYIKAIG
jgi:FkbH-like protein